MLQPRKWQIPLGLFVELLLNILGLYKIKESLNVLAQTRGAIGKW